MTWFRFSSILNESSRAVKDHEMCYEDRMPTRICFLHENWCLPLIGVMQFGTESQVLVQQRDKLRK